MNIFVGNLLFEATENDVRKLFEGFGVVSSVAIVMEKKGIKSRGFGFVEMPDDAQAQAAIAALDGKPFMDRPLNVSPAQSKPEDVQKKKSVAEHRGRFTHGYVKTGSGYKEGRRSRNYVARRRAEGEDVNLAKPVRRENPMRWRKNPSQSKPWARKYGEGPRSAQGDARGQARPWQRGSSAESKPWRRPEAGEARVWRKPTGQARPWQKSSSAESKPWRRTESNAASRPWQRSANIESKPWRRSETGEARAWRKPTGQARPWQRSTSAEPKPWRKSAGGESRTWRSPEAGESRPPRRRSQASGTKPWQKRLGTSARPAFRAGKRSGSIHKE